MTEKTIRGLLIEDDSEDQFLLAKLLAEPGWPAVFSLQCADDLKSGLALLSKGGVEVVLLDLMLPDSRGIDTVGQARRSFPGVPIVVLTGLSDEQMGLEAVAQGAQDYLIKGKFDGQTLRRTLCYAVERHRLMVRAESVIQLEAEVRERKRVDKLKDELMNVVSHEIRNPLTIIKAAVFNLREGPTGPLNKDQAELLWLAGRSVSRLEKIVDNVLDLSRLESGRAQFELQPVDVAQLVRESVAGFRLLAADKNIWIRQELPPSLPFVLADPALLAQVLANLLANALRFSRTSILVRATVSESGEKCVKISVEDDGPGIPVERRGELFSKFVQAHRRVRGEGYQGTGLGLAICREIIERQKGKIWFECPPEGGTRFHFLLPQSRPAEVAREGP